MESPYELQMNDPFVQYSLEEIKLMNEDEFALLMERHSKYVRDKHRLLQESNHQVPKFNTLEELMEYYDAIPLDDAINNWDSFFEENDNHK